MWYVVFIDKLGQESVKILTLIKTILCKMMDNNMHVSRLIGGFGEVLESTCIFVDDWLNHEITTAVHQ